MKLTGAERTYQAFIYVCVGLLLVISIFPLIYVAGLSFTSEKEFMQRGNMMVIPYQPTLTGYRRIFLYDSSYLRAFGVSALRTVVGTSLTLMCTLSMGYVLSRQDLPGRKALLIMVMLTVLYSGGLIPTFLVVLDLRLLDTFWAMIIPGLVDSWGVLVFKQFFSNLPREIEESAHMDGCGEVRLLLSIVLPMSLAVTAAMGLFAAVGHWNSWFDGLIYIQTKTEWQPLQLLLRNLFINANLGFDVNKTNAFMLGETQTLTPTSLRMVVTMIGTVPILCVYPFLQRYFVKGVYVGAIKG